MTAAEQLALLQVPFSESRVMLRQPINDVEQLTHWQSLVVPHASHKRPVHPSDSVAAEAPIKAKATATKNTFRYMTAAQLIAALCARLGDVSAEKRRE